MGVVNRDEVLRSFCMKLRQVGRAQICRLLGTVTSTDGRYKAWIDVLERGYILRAELNAVMALLLEKGVITLPEIQKTLEAELRLYFDAVAAEWPEMEFTEVGLTIKDLPAMHARSKREGWPP